jgi:hypothetical protein
MNGGAIKAIFMGLKVSNTSKMPNRALAMRQLLDRAAVCSFQSEFVIKSLHALRSMHT